MSFQIEAACSSNIGLRRTNNEDNFYFDGRILPMENEGLKKAVTLSQKLDKELIFGIFDGMGGENYGEEASFIAASTAQNTQKQLADFIYPPKKYLTDLVLQMNEEVCKALKEHGTGRMGSTVAMLYLSGKNIYVCNVGDSKAFRLRKNELLQVSKDHTDANFLAEQGITNRKPSLTQHLGILPEEMILEPHIAKGDLMYEDQYLICSDGLTDMVSSVEICAILKEEQDIGDCADKLIAKALENGGRDNVTVIIIRIVKKEK